MSKELEVNFGHNLPEYSVSEISGVLKRTVEDKFGYVRIRGEVSGLKVAPSGHVYLNLKDEAALIKAVCWKGAYAKLKFKPQEGLEMICTGSITTYPNSSSYQLVIETVEPAGAGALMAMFEERKKKLALEGLFDPARKKTIAIFAKYYWNYNL